MNEPIEDLVKSLEELEEKYPEEYAAFIEDMAEQFGVYDEVIDYPEDW